MITRIKMAWFFDHAPCQIMFQSQVLKRDAFYMVIIRDTTQFHILEL
jgi:hypothetical protein